MTEDERPSGRYTLSIPLKEVEKDDNSSDDSHPKPEPDPTDDDEALRSTQWKDLFNFTTKKHIPILILSCSLAIICGAAIPAQSYLLGKVFDLFAKFGAGTITGDGLKSGVAKYCTYLAALAAANWVLNTLYFISWISFGEMQAKSARERLFKALLGRDTEWFDMRKNGVGALVPRLQMQTRELQMSVSQPLGYVLECLATSVLSLALAMYYSWKLTLVILCVLPVVFLAIGLLSTRLQPNIDGQSDKLNEALKYAMSAMHQIETVKCFNGQDLEIWKYSRIAAEAARYYVRQANLNALQMGAMSLATFGMFIQGFWYGSSLLDKGQSPGHILTTFWAAMMATQGLMSFLPQLMVLEKGRSAGAKLRAVMVHGAKNQKEALAGTGLRPHHCKGDIELKKVDFAYPIRRNELALKDASMFFAAGEMTFVIGKSGSGKSTVGQLLSRFYEPMSGQITLDNQLIGEIDIAWLRRNLTLVEQTSVLFAGTIRENISYGKEDFEAVSFDDVKMAAQFALLTETINDMQDSWDTFVGSKGSSMSGGQRQRAALARARLRDTPILILDESTSALDYINRSLILDAIRQWRRGKTTIVITHDIAQITPGDYVYILEKGRVVQEGFRREMEKATATPFQKFLVIKEEDEEQDFDEEMTEEQAIRKSMVRQASVSSSTYSENDLDAFSPVDPLDQYLNRNDMEECPRYIPSIFIERPANASNRDSMRLPPAQGQFWRVVPQLGPLGGITPGLTPGGGTSPTESKRFSRFLPQNDLSTPTSEYAEEETMGLGFRNSVISQRKRRSESMMMKNRTSVTSTPLPPRPRMSTVFAPVEREQLSPFEKVKQLFLKKRKSHEGEREILTIKQILTTVWPRLNWTQRVLLIIAFGGCVCHAVATPVFAFVFSRLLTTFYMAEGRAHKATIYSIAILAIAIFDALANYMAHFLLEYCGMMWVHSVRVESMRRILEQPREFFDREENNVNKLAETLDYSAEEMRNLLGRFTGFGLIAILMMSTAIIWSFVSSWKLSLVGLAIAPVFYAATNAFSTVSGRQESFLNDVDEIATTIFAETFCNIRTVRSLTLEKMLLKKYLNATQNILQVGIKRAIYVGVFFGLIESIIFFVESLLFYYGAVLVASREFSTSDILEVFTQLTMSMTNVNGIVALIPQMGSSRDTATRLLRLCNLPQTSHEFAGTTRIPSIGDIAFHDLRFRYPSRPEQEVLRGINTTIKAGTSVAIVGTSGSGKSTISNLLLNLYSTDIPGVPALSSAITLAGRDIRRIHTPTLRSLVTVVAQSPTIFPATVAENITYGLRDFDPAKAFSNVRAAAQAAGIDDFIMSLPQGYDTLIGEGGVGLSGGQAQRVAITRALVRQPNVLILDEATSALDVENAEIVRQTVLRLVAGNREAGETTSGNARGMTVIIITHSREMMAIAEHIVMLNQGRIVEEGPFEELCKRKGDFARLLRGEAGEGTDGWEKGGSESSSRKGKGKDEGLGIE